MKGRKNIPTKLKILEGNPGRRPIKIDPEPQSGIPSMPEWLKEFPVAVDEWNRESEILNSMGVMTVAEAALLATRCYVMSEIQQLAFEIKNEGRVAYTQKMDSLGNEVMEAKANPKAIQIKNLITEHRQMGSLLGFDPASRAKLSVSDSGNKSKFDGLVGNAKKQRKS